MNSTTTSKGPTKTATAKHALLWDVYSDLLSSPFSTAILLMQAAHPDVGEAVGQYSVYREDPWGRLFRTGFSMMRFLYPGNPTQRTTEAKNLRHLHSFINGTRADGTHFRALSAQTFRIVPDTFLDGAIRIRQVLNKPLDKTEQSQLYAEYLRLCELFGIPKTQLEPDLTAFQTYFDDLLLNTMTYNETVAFLLEEMLEHGPKVKYIPLPRVWRQALYRRCIYPMLRLFTLGFLDPRFKEKHQLQWSDQDEQKYQRALRWLWKIQRITPRWLRYHPFGLYLMLGGHGSRLTTRKNYSNTLDRNKP